MIEQNEIKNTVGISKSISFVLPQAYFDKAINTGMKIRVALVAAIYRKV